MTINLLNPDAIMNLQAELLKTERETQHALAIVEIQLALNQYGQGLLTGKELMSRIFGITAHAHPLRVGDVDVLNGETVDDESPESFLARVDASFALKPVTAHHDGKKWMEIPAARLEPVVGTEGTSESDADSVRVEDIFQWAMPLHEAAYEELTKTKSVGDVRLDGAHQQPANLHDDFVYTEGREPDAGEGHWFDTYKHLKSARLSDKIVARIRRLIYDTRRVDAVNRLDPYTMLQFSEGSRELAELQAFQFGGHLQDGEAYKLRSGATVRVLQKIGFANFMANNGIEYTSLGVALSENRNHDVLYECSNDKGVAAGLTTEVMAHMAAVLESTAGLTAEARGTPLIVTGMVPFEEPLLSGGLDPTYRAQVMESVATAKPVIDIEDQEFKEQLQDHHTYMCRNGTTVTVERLGFTVNFRGDNGIMYEENGRVVNQNEAHDLDAMKEAQEPSVIVIEDGFFYDTVEGRQFKVYEAEHEFRVDGYPWTCAQGYLWDIEGSCYDQEFKAMPEYDLVRKSKDN